MADQEKSSKITYLGQVDYHNKQLALFIKARYAFS